MKLTFAGGEVYDFEPATLPNLYYGQPLRLYGRYRQGGPVKINLKAEVLGQAIDQTVEMSVPARGGGQPPARSDVGFASR